MLLESIVLFQWLNAKSFRQHITGYMPAKRLNNFNRRRIFRSWGRLDIGPLNPFSIFNSRSMGFRSEVSGRSQFCAP
jgi:hypothetical protein